jgi:hypothetical protein
VGKNEKDLPEKQAKEERAGSMTQETEFLASRGP